MSAAKRFSEEIILGSREDAERVLVGMEEQLEAYQKVTVSDLKDLLGVTGSHVDNTWGWVDLAGSSVRQVRDGWILDLPRDEKIN